MLPSCLSCFTACASTRAEQPSMATRLTINSLGRWEYMTSIILQSSNNNSLRR